MLCFLRHSTSKIIESKDLLNITSKGFRGEALSSIAAVSQLEIVSRRKVDKFGCKLKIEGGKIKSSQRVVSPVGTNVLVKNLFFNVPARRNFLKSDSVELKHIINEFHRISIPHYNLNISLNHKKSEIFSLYNSNCHSRIKIVYIFARLTEHSGSRRSGGCGAVSAGWAFSPATRHPARKCQQHTN